MEINASGFVPPLATSARTLALRNGRRKRRLVALRLSLVTLAAVFGALSIAWVVAEQRLDLAGVAAVLAFVAVLGIRLVMQGDRELNTAEPRAQAVAEIVTSQAWRYAAGARPYALVTEGPADGARLLFLEKLRGFQQILLEYSWSAPPGLQITEQMSALRSAPLSERKETYLAQRVAPLLGASSDASQTFGARGRWLIVAVLCVELIGIPAGAVKAVGLSTLDLLGIVAAAAASLALWADTLSYPQRARLAATTGMTLASATDLLVGARTEHEWAVLVARLEDQLSLEFEAALASDTVGQPLGARADDVHSMTPDEYFGAAEELKRQIWERSDRLPKLEPDVIVALNPGGAILGGILYFMTTRASDFLPLTYRGGLEDDDLERMVSAYSWTARKPGRLSILVVDASVKSGETLGKAVTLLRRVVESKGWQPAVDGASGDDPTVKRYVIRTAVIAKKPVPGESDDRVRVDYYIDELTERFPYGNI